MVPAVLTSVLPSNGGSLAVKEGGATVSSAVKTLDFGTGFDVSESPTGEANISLDLSEVTINAEDVQYDNGTSGLTATNVQAAIDELAIMTASGGAESFFDDFSSASSGALGILWSNSYKTGENAGGNNSCQLISHQFFGGNGGNYYFEVEVVVGISGGIGVAQRSRAFSNNFATFVGLSNENFGYWANGDRYTANVSTPGYATYGTSDIIGVAVNTAEGKIWWAKNNVWQGGGDPAAGTSPGYTSNYLKRQLHVHLTPYSNGEKFTLKALSSELTYAPPAGFVAAFD